MRFQNLKEFLSLNLLIFSFSIAILGQSSNLEIYAEKLRFGTIEEKREALYQLRNLSNEAASRVAISGLSDASEIVRATATHSILSLSSEESCTLLLPLLSEKLAFVRKETVYALGKTKNFRATEFLIKILEKDKDLEVRGAAAFALGLIGDVKSVENLISALNQKNLFVERSAARSLGQIKNEKSLISLEKKLQEPKLDDDVRREIIWAIAEIKNFNKI